MLNRTWAGPPGTAVEQSLGAGAKRLSGRADVVDEEKRLSLDVAGGEIVFDAVQFGYDAYEDGWILESTATWVEDELFDKVNDNRFYLADSPLSRPSKSLDRFGGLYHYGAWIWWRFLTEAYPARGTSGLPLIMRLGMGYGPASLEAPPEADRGILACGTGLGMAIAAAEGRGSAITASRFTRPTSTTPRFTCRS